jgi:hypothetical protein
MAATFIGKFIIGLTLCFQAYILFSDATVAAAFNSNTSKMLSSCDCIPANIAVLVKEHLRLVVVGLLASSVLMILTNFCIFKCFVLLGLLTVFTVEHHTLRKLPCIGNQ